MYMYDQPDEVPTLLDMDSQNLCTPSNSMSSLTMPVVKSEPLDMPAMMPPQAIKREPHDMMGMSQLEYIKTEPQHMMDYNHMGVMNMNSHMYPMTNYPHPMMHSLPPLPPQPHQIQQQQQQQQQQHQHNTALTQPERKPGKKSKIKQEKITDNFKEKKPRRKVDRFHGTPEEEVAKRTLPDILMPNLDIVIIGINPGLMAAYKGHHYAGPGNHFWKCLYLSGLVDEPMTCMDDHRLLQFNIGFTNIVSRTTRGSSDLTRKEIKDGARILTDKMRKYRPLIACFNGKGIYEIFSGKKDFEIGRQPETMPDTDTVIYVMPSSSARCSQFPRATDKVNFYTTLKELRDELKQMKRKTAPPLPALPPPPQSTTQQPQDQQQQQQQQQQQPTQLQQPAQQPSAQQQQKEQQQQQQQPAVKVKQEGGQPANCPGQQQGQTTPVRVKMENQNDCVTSCTSSGSTAYHGTVQGPVPHQSLPALPPHAGPMLIKQEPGSFYPNTCGGQYPQPPPPLPSGRQEPGMGYPVIKQEMPDPQMRHYGAGGLPATTAHNQFQPGYFMDQIPTIGMGENGAMPMRNHLPPQQQQQQQAQQQQMVNNHATGNGPMAMPPAPIDPAMPNYGHSYPDPRGASPHPYPQQMFPQQHLQQQQQQQHPPPQYPQQMSQQPEPNQKQQHSGPSTT